MLTVTVLGSSGMFATRERAASGYLLEFDDRRIWMDAGGGTWRHVIDLIDYERIDGVLLTHRHPDHTIDLFQCFHARRYGAPEPLPPIPLWAPAETLERVTSFSTELEESFDLQTLVEDEALDIHGAHVTFTRMAHPPVTLGVRVEYHDAVLAYSADSGAEADFEGLTHDAGLFICEATLQDVDELWWGHLRASQVGELAKRIGLPRVMLTHLPPGRDHEVSLAEGRRTAGDANVLLARDGLRLEVG